MASPYAAKPFSYLAPKTNQAAPKSGLRKEENIYSDLAVSALNESRPTRADNMPPLVAAKPMAIRPDRLVGHDAEWKLHGEYNAASSSSSQPQHLPAASSNRNQPIIAPTRPTSIFPPNASSTSGTSDNRLNVPLSGNSPARTPTTSEDVGGGISDNFILVGSSRTVDDVDRPRVEDNHDESRRRFEKLFAERDDQQSTQRPPLDGGSGSVEFDRPHEYSNRSTDIPGLNDYGEVGRQHFDRLPWTHDETDGGIENRSLDEPRYQLYGGPTAVLTTTPVDQHYSPIKDSHPNSFNKSDTFLVPPSKSHSKSPINSDIHQYGPCCRCTRTTAVVVAAAIVLVGLVLFGAGFIAGWFGHRQSVTPTSLAGAGDRLTSTTAASTKILPSLGGQVTSSVTLSTTLSTGRAVTTNQRRTTSMADTVTSSKISPDLTTVT